MAATTTTQSGSLHLPVSISGANLHDLTNLGTRTGRLLHDHLNLCTEKLRVMGECQAKFVRSERVMELDEALRDVIDVQHDVNAIQEAIKAVAQDHLYHGSTRDPATEILERTEVRKLNWRDASGMVKYSTNKAFDDFKRGVFDIEHPEDDFPGIASFFQQNNNDTAAATDDNDLEMTYHTKRSLKCPITMMTFQHPVRSKLCVHVFSKDAILEMLKRNGGVIDCPVAGCDKKLMESNLERDRVMERRVREEEEDERQGEELSSELGHDDHVLDIL